MPRVQPTGETDRSCTSASLGLSILDKIFTFEISPHITDKRDKIFLLLRYTHYTVLQVLDNVSQ